MNTWLCLLLNGICGVCGISIGYHHCRRKIIGVVNSELYRIRGLYNPHRREAQLDVVERVLGKL